MGNQSMAFSVCSSVLLDYMKDQQEKTNTMLKQFEHLKVNVEKVVEMCECSTYRVSLWIKTTKSEKTKAHLTPSKSDEFLIYRPLEYTGMGQPHRVT